MGIYTFRAWFSVTAANPVGPGLHCADPSVSINMDLSEVQSQNFWCTPLYSLLFGNTLVRHGMKKASWIDEISWGMAICSMSNLCVFERCVRSYIQNDVKCISGVFCFSFVVFVIFLLIHSQFFLRILLLFYQS